MSLEDIQLDRSQRKGGTVVLARMNWTECHRVVHGMPEDPMYELCVIGKGQGQDAIYAFVEETETGHRSSSFKGPPVQLSQK